MAGQPGIEGLLAASLALIIIMLLPTPSGLLERIAANLPHAGIRGFTVQPMIRRAHAHELILGMSVDQTFGPLMMFGAGGTAIEVLRDTAHALSPLDRNLARDMMRQTRVWGLLQGYRNRAPADLDAIADTLVRLSYLIARHPEIRGRSLNQRFGTRGSRNAVRLSM